MARIELKHGGLRAEIEPAIGAGLARLAWRGRDVMRPAREGTTWFNDLACYVLAPWSNRIAGAEFEWRGVRHRMRPDWEDGTAIHGLVKDRAWEIEQRSPVSAVLTCRGGGNGFPWQFTAQLAYELGEGCLRMVLEVRNDGGADGPMPAGLGFHPFWLRALDGGADEAIVRIGGLRRYPCRGMIPTDGAREDEITRALAGTRRGRRADPGGEGLCPPDAVVDGAAEGACSMGLEVGRVNLDDVFAGSAHGAEILWARSGVRARYRCSEELGHTVVFNGRAGCFGLEPVTMVNDGFNLASRGWEGTGVRELGRGESMRAEWTVEVGTI